MHEFSIASSIVEKVVEFAEQHGISKVVGVRLEVGELTCVDVEQLRFCLEAITHDTVVENCAFEVETVDALVHCQHCSYEGPPKYWECVQSALLPTLECPECGFAAEAIAGHSCAIKSVRVMRESDSPDASCRPA
jgi:hydrogenase nickel incorporation protein HypA/HybF